MGNNPAARSELPPTETGSHLGAKQMCKKDQQLLEAYRQLAIHFAQAVVSGPQPFNPPEDGDWLRSSLEMCAMLEPDAERAKKLRDATWEPIMYCNVYGHLECGTSWESVHSCQIDDECQKCGASISPIDSRRVA